MSIEELNRVLEKVRKLLNLSAGATGPEAETALAAAQRLMDAYDLDQTAVSEHEVNRTFETKCFDRMTRLSGVVDAVSSVLQSCFHVDLLWNAEQGELLIFGQPHHIKVAAYAYVVLCRQFKQKWHESGNTRGSAEYFKGMAAVVIHNLQSQAANPQGLITLDDARKRAFAQQHPGYESQTVRVRDEDSFSLGVEDGRDIRVHKPVGHAAPRIAGRIS